MKTYGLRMLGYLLNVIVLIGPVIFLANNIYFGYQKLMNIQSFTGYEILETFDLARYTFFLPSIFIDTITKAIYISETFMFGIPIIVSFTLFDSIISYFLKTDIGKKGLKLRIVTDHNEMPKLNQIILRCIVKYSTLAFIPFCLIYPMFDRNKLMLHDRIARTRLVKA